MEQNIVTAPTLHNEKLVFIDDNDLAHPISTQQYITAATSDNTRRAYQSDIRHFIEWGGFLPTSAEIIIQYLQQQAGKLNPRTLVRRLTALKNWHLYQGFTDPTSHPMIRKTLSGIKHIHGKPKNKAKALTVETLVAMIDYLRSSSRLIDYRNNALLQVGFFGAFRRSELVFIRWEHIHFVPEGVEILIPRSKTDQDGEGQICAIPYGDKKLCPITALVAWRDQSSSQSGFVFLSIGNNEHLKEEAIRPNQINVIIKSVAKACQLPEVKLYSSHSMRRGFATEASKKGAPFGAIMRQGRWRHEGTVLGYIEEGKRFDSNAADIILKHKDKNAPWTVEDINITRDTHGDPAITNSDRRRN
jgi:integrase